MSVVDDVKSVLLGYLEEARIDLIVFRLLSANSDEGVRRRALFHLQQASEKLAKTHVYYVMRVVCTLIKRIPMRECNEVITENRETIIRFLKKGYGHNAEALVNLEQRLRNLLLKEKSDVIKHAVTRLIEKAKASLLRELSEKEREKLEQSIKNLFTQVRDFSIAVLDRYAEDYKSHNQPSHSYSEYDYGCVNDVLRRFRSMDSLLGEFDKLRGIVNDLIQQLPDPQKRNDCDAILDLTRRFVMAFVYSSIIDLPLVNCMRNFEQTSRYCLAEDVSKCPPVDEESMKKYLEISRYLEEFMNSVEHIIKALDQLSKIMETMASNASYSTPEERDKYLEQFIEQCILPLLKIGPNEIVNIIDALASSFKNTTNLIRQQTP
jgi:Mg2+ and Co2+ transporter CorA